MLPIVINKIITTRLVKTLVITKDVFSIVSDNSYLKVNKRSLGSFFYISCSIFVNAC